MKSFYIYHQFAFLGLSSARGVACLVEEEDDHHLNVRVTFCSPKDQFCKREARIELDKKPWEIINKRDLPLWLHYQDQRGFFGYYSHPNFAEFKKNSKSVLAHRFNHYLKYVI